MTRVLVLAYDGEFDVREAIASLRRAHGAEVVTMTVDIGQSRDLRATRDAALKAGAARAHAFDGVDDFVRGCVLPVLQAAPWRTPEAGHRSSVALAHPIIAARLVEVARLERTRTVAHGGGAELTAAIRAVDASLEVCTIDSQRLDDDRPSAAPSRHLLQRPVADPARARGVVANLEIRFADDIPVAINGVALTLPELIESLSLIGGEHGIGHAEAVNTPGALVLDTAYRALDRPSGVVRIELLDGHQRIVPSAPELVNHA